MDTFIDILNEFLPVIGTGLITFLITKYSYNKEVPLDKMEIAYNRLYYPMYRLTRENSNISEVVGKSGEYLKKYGKYVDRSTIVAYNFLYENQDDKNAYENFKNNIFAICLKLRRRLGYLEPSFFNMYTYSAPKEKALLNILFAVMVMYISLTFLPISMNTIWQAICMLIFWVSFVAVILEIILVLIRSVKKLFGKLFKKKKSDISENKL